MIPMPVPLHGYTIFCDDIRYETGGKYSLIGVYRSEMIIHGEFPFILPKFVLAITYLDEPVDHPDTVQLMVYLPGDPDDQPRVKGELPVGQVMKNVPAPAKSTDVLEIQTVMVFAPLTIRSEGLIRVRAVRSDEVVKLNSLSVVKAPAEAEVPGAKASEN